jgi:hypothetical protein
MWNISAAIGRILPKFEIKAYVTKPNFTIALNEVDLKQKMSSKY